MLPLVARALFTIVVLLPESNSQSFPVPPTTLPTVALPFTVAVTSEYVVLFALSKLNLCLGWYLFASISKFDNPLPANVKSEPLIVITKF